MGAVEIVAIIPTKPVKLDRVAFTVELLQGMAEKTQANEPGALRYAIHQELAPTQGQEGVDIVMVEFYKDEEAQKHHMQTPYFQEFAKALMGENLLRGLLSIKVIKMVGGFAGR